ncbi:Formate dehydrogenase-O subunit gamma [Jannaschia seosinensis]|uniref:Formate dehydrogenase-O subunit gamma n=1 Tax=Jannaschia seosinensis TaxID=313367 RepID=A0A0M7BB05_9RHOB|nr:formate dehydrogenase subunit gamma [Jannaschia seosinensis]CUH39002.1 Formate dehydrogenase-O subunit gamma [Jannaschia seosinensis]
MIRAIAFILTLMLALPAMAQESAAPSGGRGDPLIVDGSATGGATTLEEIMARQDALRAGATEPNIDTSDRQATTGAPGGPITEPLGALGGASDADLWRGVRYDTADIRTQQRGPAAATLIQDGGMWWQEFRAGPLRIWGGFFLLAVLALLAVFYAFRGRIRLHGPRTGRTLLRFKTYERFGHWLLAGSFIALGLTGLLLLFGRVAVIPVFGHEAWAPMAIASKWVHNNISWAFMLALAMIFVIWVVQNIPNKDDLKWLAKGGGLLGGGHVPARKFNAGQKMIFWAVIVGGVSLSASGLSLLFPFELPMFAGTFEALNGWGLPQALGLAPFDADLAPQEEMQYAQLWHSIVAFVLTAIIFAHIYLGSVGMEGAYDAMGKGEVEEQWAREHHSIWAKEAIRERDDPSREQTGSPHATPAE